MTNQMKWTPSLLVFTIYFLCGVLMFFFGMTISSHSHHESCDAQIENIIESHSEQIASKNAVNKPCLVKKQSPASCSEVPFHTPTGFEIIKNTNQPKKPVFLGEEATNAINPLALDTVFHMYHHNLHPLSTEILLTAHNPTLSLNSKRKLNNTYDHCQTVYLTRTGSLKNMPNKCVSVAFIPQEFTDPIPHYVRKGKISGMIDMFQGDYINNNALKTESILLPLFLRNIENLIIQFQQLIPLNNNSDKSVIIMVLNEGVLDVFLNFLCSLRNANIFEEVIEKLVTFVGQESLVSVLQNLGVKVFYSPFLGPIPTKAAEAYGDFTFAVLMWLKTTAVYIGLKAGYHVLFQDVDLVWMTNPLPNLLSSQYNHKDVIFMDDGARTPRFTPLYVNSGFYFLRYTKNSLYLMERLMKSVSEVAVSHSHQSVLTRYLTEITDLQGISIDILDMYDYPSGYLYHHEKLYIHDMLTYKILPKVFHMCWTESRKQKVEYFQSIGLWLLPNDNSSYCYSAKQMINQINQNQNNGKNVLNDCCQIGEYWRKRNEQKIST